MSGDQGLQFVSSIDIERNSTPVRLPVRNLTPPRSNSNPRAGGSATRKRLLVASDKLHSEAPDSGPNRPISRRRQRRWENKNLMGVEQLTQILAAAGDSDGDESHRRDGVVEQPLRIEWRSAFQELFVAENRDALETFRQCAEHFTVRSSYQRAYASAAERTWFQVGRRLRGMVQSCLAENPARLFPFLGALEDNLLHFANHKTLKPHEADGRMLASYLACPLIVDKDGVLHVFLRDFKGNRFVLHAVAQFFGLQSKSYKKKSAPGKITAVTAPSRPSAAAAQRLSLTSYLLQEHLQRPNLLGEAESVEDSGSCEEVEDLRERLHEVL